MQCFEWWCFEILAIFAGMLSNSELAAQVAIINIITLLFMIPLGVQFAASSLVGIQIGAGNPLQAQKYAITSIIFALLAMGILVAFCQFHEDFVARLFTDDPTTVSFIKTVLPLMSLYLLIDTVHGVQTGNVRGLGKQGPASIIILVCYYVCGVPLAIYLGFYRDWRLLGFWSGMLAAIALSQILIAYLVMTADWNLSSENEDGTV